MQSIKDIKIKLKKDLENQQGTISISLSNISIDIHGKDIIGNAIQEWLGSWFDKNNIQYRILPNTQEFPDYIIKFNKQESFLEIKTWNYDKGPAFDLANFNSYIDSLNQNPAKIDADYLIFGYITNEKGFTIKNIYSKKIWELAGKSSVDPLKIQKKKGIVYNIRPVSFHKKPETTFKSRKEFLSALAETKKKYKNQGTNIPDIAKWKEEILKKYYLITNHQL